MNIKSPFAFANASYEIIVLLKKLRQRSGRCANRGNAKRLKRELHFWLLDFGRIIHIGDGMPILLLPGAFFSRPIHKLPPGMWDHPDQCSFCARNVSRCLRQIQIIITSQHPTFQVKPSAVNDEHFGCDSSDVYTPRKRSSVGKLRVPQREQDSAWQNPSYIPNLSCVGENVLAPLVFEKLIFCVLFAASSLRIQPSPVGRLRFQPPRFLSR